MSQRPDEPPPRRTPYRIETERLVLRPYEPADAPALRDVCARNREHFLPWLLWAEDDPQTVDEKLELILTFRSKFDAESNWVIGVFERSTGALVAGSGLHPSEGKDTRYVREIGYWVDRSREGEGLVGEAVMSLLHVAFRWLRCAAVVIRCHPGNVRSRAIPERLGFQDEGLARAALTPPGRGPIDVHRYTLTLAEFGQRRERYECALEAFDALGRPLVLDD